MARVCDTSLRLKTRPLECLTWAIRKTQNHKMQATCGGRLETNVGLRVHLITYKTFAGGSALVMVKSVPGGALNAV